MTEPLDRQRPPTGDTAALAVADAAGRALAAGDHRPALKDFIRSPTYPVPAGTAPDRFVRRLADLVPDYRAEADDPDTTGDIHLTVTRPDGSGRGVSITLNLPTGEGYGPVEEWRVTGNADGGVEMQLTLLHRSGEQEFVHAIRLLRAHGALPEGGSTINGNAGQSPLC